MNKFSLIPIMGITLIVVGCGPKKKKDNTPKIPTAMTLEISPQTHPLRFESIGELKPINYATITPLVSGPITWVNPNLGPGFKVQKGTVLYKIDPTDYSLRLKQKEASLTQAKLAYEEEKIRFDLAQKQWQREDSLNASPLAKRDMHLELAKANLSAAQASYDEANIQLSRTQIRAPFSGVVLSSGASLGMMASSASPQTTLSGEEKLKIEISLSSKQADIIPSLPRDVKITQNLPDGSTREGMGQLVQLSKVLDPSSRKLVGTVLFNSNSSDSPISGSYVNVSFEGESQDNRAMIPSSAILPSREVWIVKENKLEIQPVRVLWESTDSVLIQIEQPLNVVILPPEGPLPGMPVKGIPFQGSNP